MITSHGATFAAAAALAAALLRVLDDLYRDALKR